jgi:hypothetical protein
MGKGSNKTKSVFSAKERYVAALTVIYYPVTNSCVGWKVDSQKLRSGCNFERTKQTRSKKARLQCTKRVLQVSW